MSDKAPELRIPEVFLLMRKRAGLSQSELAERARVHRNSISSIENGAVGNVKISTLVRIAEALGCEIKFSITHKD